MADPAKAAYSHRQWVWAVNLSALWGWGVLALPGPIDHILSGRSPHGLSQISLFALFSLPIAFLAAWIVVAPILKSAMRRPMRFARAAFWCSLVSGVIVLVSVAIGRFRGWAQSLNPNFNSQLGGGDKIREIDGILTPYGWLVLAKLSLFFMLACVVGAVLIRLLIGPGRLPYEAQ